MLFRWIGRRIAKFARWKLSGKNGWYGSYNGSTAVLSQPEPFLEIEWYGSDSSGTPFRFVLLSKCSRGRPSPRPSRSACKPGTIPPALSQSNLTSSISSPENRPKHRKLMGCPMNDLAKIEIRLNRRPKCVEIQNICERGRESLPDNWGLLRHEGNLVTANPQTTTA